MMVDIKNIVLGIAIFLLTLFVGIYGLSTLHGDTPEYDDYCPSNIHINSTICESEGGVWINNTQLAYDSRGESKPIAIPAEGGSCQYDYTLCQKEWDDAQEKYYKKIFLTGLPLGIIVIALGALVFGLESVGGGLMAGGIAILIYAAGSYWRFADDVLKFILSLAGLVIVVWLTYYWNKRMHKKK
jgi:hypothetical protein